jgi:phosphosulfolactate phosphohydrolase-like enzyme
MNVQKHWFADLSSEEIEGIRRKHEIVVVVDLWAATTNLVIMLGKKPARLFIVNDDRFSKAQLVYPGAILIGESQEIPREKFASSNEPSEISQVNIYDKDVLYITFNGTRVLGAFSNQEKGLVFAASLANYRTVADYLKKVNVGKINLIAAGNLTGELQGREFTEDWMVAELLEKELKSENYDYSKVQTRIKKVVEDIYGVQSSLSPEKRFWPFIFAPKADIVPMVFINREGFVEVLRLRSG